MENNLFLFSRTQLVMHFTYCYMTASHPCLRTVGGQSVWLSTLGVGRVDGWLLHAAELRLPSVRRHGGCRRRGQDVGVGPLGREGKNAKRQFGVLVWEVAIAIHEQEPKFQWVRKDKAGLSLFTGQSHVCTGTFTPPTMQLWVCVCVRAGGPEHLLWWVEWWGVLVSRPRAVTTAGDY